MVVSARQLVFEPDNCQNGFIIKLPRSTHLKTGTGEKIRRTKSKVSFTGTEDTFDFNKSIAPHGGLLSRLKIKQNKKGFYSIRIFQDVDNDGVALKDELIYKGKSQIVYPADELTDFSGRIFLTKRMHQCDWMTAKYPGQTLMCTMEYIPVVYNCVLVDGAGQRYAFDGINGFESELVGLSLP